MSLHRRAVRRDESEAEIIKTLQALGWSVYQLSIPNGPDLLLGRRNENWLAECKTGNAPLRPGQLEWIHGWNGAPVVILRSTEDACLLSQGQWPRVLERKRQEKRRA